MTCRELIAVLDDDLDAILPPHAHAEFEQRLTECAPCRAFLATYR